LLAPYNGSIAKIQKYLELNSLRPQNPNLFTFSLKNPTPDSPLRWALTKMDLAELLLALSHARVLRTSFVTQRTPPANPAAAAAVVPAPLPILSVNCKILKYNLLRKRGVSVFNPPLLSNPLKISTLHFTPLVPS